MLLDILFVVSVRFFIFDFAHFNKIRNYIKNKFAKNYFISTFLKCPFCQGFWTGLFFSLLKNETSVIENVYFGFITAIVCLCWNTIFWPLIDKYEKKYK